MACRQDTDGGKRTCRTNEAHGLRRAHVFDRLAHGTPEKRPEPDLSPGRHEVVSVEDSEGVTAAFCGQELRP